MDQTPSLKTCLFLHWKGVVLIIIPFVFIALMKIDDDYKFRCLYLILIMAVCWIGELIPIPITAMMPVVAFPLMNIMKSDKACSMFFKSTTVQFIVTLIISRASEHTLLHQRVAVHMLKMTGTHPKKIHILLMLVSLVVSFFLPNGVAIGLVQPFTNAVLENLTSLGLCSQFIDDTPGIPRFRRKPTRAAIAYHLSTAYATTIGGTAALTATPTNLIMKEIYDKRFSNGPDLISFANFIKYGLVPSVIFWLIMVVYMQFTFFGPDTESTGIKMGDDEIAAADSANREKYDSMGTVTFGQCLTSLLFLIMAILMITRDPKFTGGWAEKISPKKELLNASVTAFIVYFIFALPADLAFLKCWDESSARQTPGLLSWKYANVAVPWDVIFSVGVGGTLSEGARSSGLASRIGEMMCKWHTHSHPICLLLVIIFTMIISNITVNTAVMFVLAPGIIQLGVVAKTHPMYFLMPACLACNWTFLLPTATPANTLVNSTEKISTKNMFLTGLVPSVIGIVVIFIIGLAWAPTVYSGLDKLPKWAAENTNAADYGETGPAN